MVLDTGMNTIFLDGLVLYKTIDAYMLRPADIAQVIITEVVYTLWWLVAFTTLARKMMSKLMCFLATGYK